MKQNDFHRNWIVTEIESWKLEPFRSYLMSYSMERKYKRICLDTTQDKDEGKLHGSRTSYERNMNETWTKHERVMNETWTNGERYFSLSVRERHFGTLLLSFIVHERIRSCVVHVWFVHERFLLISFLSFILSRTNEKPRFFSFMVNVRSSSDERMFVRPSCAIMN